MSTSPVNNFIIACRFCGEGTLCDIRLFADLAMTITCHGCGRQDRIVFHSGPVPQGFIDALLLKVHADAGKSNPSLETTTEPEEVVEKKPELSEKAKLMKKLIEKNSLPHLEKHKEELEESEYLYIKDAIMTQTEEGE